MVDHTLKKREVIVAALQMRIRKTTHKYGIEIPASVEHAYELDRNNENNLWKKALEMEMYNIGVSFEILEDGKSAPVGYTKVLLTLPSKFSCLAQPSLTTSFMQLSCIFRMIEFGKLYPRRP